MNPKSNDEAMSKYPFPSPLQRLASRRSAIKLIGLGAATTALSPIVLKGCQTSQSQAGQAGTAAIAQTNAQTAPQNSPQTSELITKVIPGTNERIPAVGMGTFLTFDVLPEQPRDNIREVMRRFWEAGGQIIDVSPLYGMSEQNIGEFAPALGMTDQLFVANKIWATGQYLGDHSQAMQQFEQSLQRLSRQRIDLMQVHSLVNVDIILPLIKELKQSGRVRYVGVTHHEPLYNAPMQRLVETGDLDFVQLRYSIFERSVEERILPAAAEQGVAVLANMPFEKARLFEVVRGQPLPDFTREIGCDTWAQYFLKFAISHPAVTAAIPATTNPDHVVDNMGALRGALPDQEMRARMIQHLETFPAFAKVGTTPPYPGKQFAGLVSLPGLAATQNARSARRSTRRSTEVGESGG
jgi:aryl-alcohol dehydrogenase-like predicted oxidoreductase